LSILGLGEKIRIRRSLTRDWDETREEEIDYVGGCEAERLVLRRRDEVVDGRDWT
jgi:hypothetical protein